MRRSLAMAVMAAALLPGHEAAAQMYKCTGAGGKVTYSSAACSTLGLKDAGEVPDRIQVTPAFQPPAQPAARRSTEDRPAATPQPAAEEEKKSDRRCFTVKTAKGTATRCNDKPDE